MQTAPAALCCLLATAIALASCTATQQRTPIDDPSTHEGLTRVDKPGIDAVYRKPAADVSKYDKLLLRPIEVAFAKNWKPGQSSGSHSMNPPDVERIKTELATAFAQIFRDELQNEGGYQLVAAPAEDVLEVRAALVNIYVNAPDVSMQTAGRSRTYTASAGEMTLIAELRDSVTGELLARAYDRREDPNSTWQWTTSVTNVAAAQRLMRMWAERLHSALDASREKGATLAEQSE